ncbi:hypothetical protein [Micromonospora sp. NBC_01813]|uniref:hypothetical protein n=1 Tax=Micromonospora sp. NBC_01813 TaxID=2975988 RepID=UPI002DDC33DC|nr:hypothetical protein [Micromonospora sp. NBC_01813]WSA08557.1 hypothetical protein OG958_30985 [Micromonospora sp. NBC_01813]
MNIADGTVVSSGQGGFVSLLTAAVREMSARGYSNVKVLTWGVFGAAVGALLVVVVGILSVQAVGLRSGAVLDLNNALVAITSPQVPYLQIFAIAVLSSAVVGSLVLGIRKLARPCGVALVAGFGVSAAALISWSFAITPDIRVARDLPLGILAGWEGWIQQGGINSAVHVALLLVLGASWQFRRPRQGGRVSGGG